MTSRENHNRLPLLEVLEDASSGNPKVQTAEYLPHGDFPVVDQGQSFIAGYVNEKEWLCRTQTPVIVFGDHTKILKFVDFPFVIGADGVKVLKTKAHADAKFVFHYLRTIQLPDVGYSRHFKFLKELEIPLPPLEVQKRITSILDAADALRAKRRESLRKLEVLLKSVFLEMFGDPVTNPKNYPMKSLGEICDVRDGTHDSPKYTQTGFPLVTSKNLVNGKVNLSGASLISETDFHEINRRSKVDMGDILMPMIGTIGNPVIVEFEPKFAIKNVALIKFNKSSIHSIYVAKLLSSSYFDLYLLKNGRGGTQKFLALGDIRTIPIPIPTQASQESFEVFWTLWKLEKEKIEASLASLETLFSSLQDQAFNGTLDSATVQLAQLEVQTSLF